MPDNDVPPRELVSENHGARLSPALPGCRLEKCPAPPSRGAAPPRRAARSRSRGRVFQMLTARTEAPAAVLFGLGPVLKCFLIFPATDSWCSLSGSPSSWGCRRGEEGTEEGDKGKKK